MGTGETAPTGAAQTVDPSRDRFKMRRINAMPNAAQVIKFKSARNHSDECLISPNMCRDIDGFIGSTPARKPKMSVTFIGAGCPEPARAEVWPIRWDRPVLVNFRPEPIGIRSTSPPLRCATSVTKTPTARWDDTPVNQQHKTCAAIFALSGNLFSSHAARSFLAVGVVRSRAVFPHCSTPLSISHGGTR